MRWSPQEAVAAETHAGRFMLSVAFLSLLLQGATVPESLSLADAVEHARGRRAEASGISARVAEARAVRRISWRPVNPTVEYTEVAADETRRLAFVQPLGSLPRLALDRRAATSALHAAAADSTQRLANLERDVVRAYFGAVASERRVTLLLELVALTDSLRTLAARRAALGDISDLDRDQFALEATRVRLQLSRAEEQRAARQAALARELAWDAAALPLLSEPLTAGLPDAAAVAAGDGASYHAADVPEVQRARLAAEAATLSARSLRWARLPIPGLLFQRDWSRVSGVPTLTRVGVSLPFPLFTRGSEAMDAGEARARVAEAQAAESAIDAERAIAAGRARVEESARRSRLAADSLVTGVVRLRAGAVRLYDAGRTSVLQVLEALRAERDAQLLAVDELLAYQEARADLTALVGRSVIPSNR